MDCVQQRSVRDALVRSLQDIYQLKAFGALADLLQGEALILQYLAANRGQTVYPSVLSDRLHLSRSRITGALNSMRRKGLVRVVPSQSDRRMMCVSITESGREQIARQMDRMLAYFDRMIQGLGVQKGQLLVDLIDQCVKIMEE